MNTEEIAAWAGVVAAIVAAIALVFTGIQTRQATRSRDFDTLSGLSERMRALEDQLLASTGDEAKMRVVSVQLLNWVELLAVGINKGLLEPASKEFAKDLVIDVLAIIDLAKMADHLDGRLTGEAYKHTSAFLAKNRKALESRKEAMVEQDKGILQGKRDDAQRGKIP